MRKVMRHGCLLCAFLVALAAFAADGPESTERTAVPAVPTALESLQIELSDLQAARAETLERINLLYLEAEPSERALLEQEFAAANVDFDRARLELIAEYHRLNGSATELANAEAQLEAFDSGLQVRDVIGRGRDIPASSAESINPNQEGVITNER